MTFDVRHDASVQRVQPIDTAPATPTSSPAPAVEGTGTAIIQDHPGLAAPQSLTENPSAVDFHDKLQRPKSPPQPVALSAAEAEALAGDDVIASGVVTSLSLATLLSGSLTPEVKAQIGPYADKLQAIWKATHNLDWNDEAQCKDAYRLMMESRLLRENVERRLQAMPPGGVKAGLTLALEGFKTIADRLNDQFRMGDKIVKGMTRSDQELREASKDVGQSLSAFVTASLGKMATGSLTDVHLTIFHELEKLDVAVTAEGARHKETGKLLTAAELDQLGSQVQRGLVTRMRERLADLQTIKATYMEHCSPAEREVLTDLIDAFEAKSKGEPPKNADEAGKYLVLDIMAAGTGAVNGFAALVDPQNVDGVDEKTLAPEVLAATEKYFPGRVERHDGKIRLNLPPEQLAKLRVTAHVISKPGSPAAQALVNALSEAAKALRDVERYAEATGTTVADIIAAVDKLALGSSHTPRSSRPGKLKAQGDSAAHEIQHAAEAQGSQLTATIEEALKAEKRLHPTAPDTTERHRQEAQFAQILQERPDTLAQANKLHRREVAEHLQAAAQEARQQYQTDLDDSTREAIQEWREDRLKR